MAACWIPPYSPKSGGSEVTPMLPSPSWPLHLDFSFLWQHKYLATKPTLQESYSTFGFPYLCVKHNVWRHQQSLLSPSWPIKSEFCKDIAKWKWFSENGLKKVTWFWFVRGNLSSSTSFKLKKIINTNNCPPELSLKCTRFVQSNNTVDTFQGCFIHLHTDKVHLTESTGRTSYYPRDCNSPL